MDLSAQTILPLAVMWFLCLVVIPGISILFSSSKRVLNDNLFETFFSVIVIGTSFISVFGIVLSEIGYFSIVNLMTISLCASIGIILINRNTFTRRIKEISIRPNKDLHFHEFLLPLLLVTLGIVLIICFPVSEWIVGTFDAGVYVNNGANIAKTGSIFTQDRMIQYVNSEEILIKNAIHGFILPDRQDGTMIASLFHLLPIWIAIFDSALGIEGGLYVTSIFGILGAFAVFMVGCQIADWKAAIIASALLIMNFVQVLFSRLPFTEVMTQFFIFGGLFLYIVSKKQCNCYLAVFAAISLAMSMFLRIDSYILLAPFVIYLVYLKISNQFERIDACFINTLSLMTIYSLIHMYVFSLHYSTNILSNLFTIIGLSRVPEIQIFALGILLIIVLTAFFNLNISKLTNSLMEIFSKIIQKGKPTVALFARFERYKFFILSGAVVAFTAYCWLIRPLDSSFTEDAYNLVKLSWFTTPVILASGIGGLVIMLNEKMSNQRILFISLFLFFFVIFTLDAQHSPYLPYMIRRYLPVVIPAMMIFSAYFFCKIVDWAPKWRKGVAVVVIGTLVLVSGCYLQDDLVLQKRVWGGAIEDVDRISNIIDDGTFIIGDTGTNPLVSPGRLIASPLKFIRGKEIIFVDQHDEQNLEKILQRVMSRDISQHGTTRAIYITECNISQLDPQALGVTVIPVQNVTITRNSIEGTLNRKPSKIGSPEQNITIYKITPYS